MFRHKLVQILSITTAVFAGSTLLILLVRIGYTVDWTGFKGQPSKTLWDWLQLLIIPAVLAVGGYMFNYTTSRNERRDSALRAQTEREVAEKRDQTEREIALDNQREAALQAYVDKMSELLLDKNLRGSSENDEIRKIARVRTLTVLPRLDAERKRSILQFIYESGLLVKHGCILDLTGADLRGANLSATNLREVNLYRADLNFADLRGADLSATSLREPNRSGTFFITADLSGANLSGAKIDQSSLDQVDVTKEQRATLTIVAP